MLLSDLILPMYTIFLLLSSLWFTAWNWEVVHFEDVVLNGDSAF